MFEKVAEISILYDFYGQLLPKKQKEFLQLYYEENYSLSEIALEYQISRQGVHDGVKKAEKALHHLEEQLGLVKKFLDPAAVLKKIDSEIDMLVAEHKNSPALVERLEGIKGQIDSLK